MGNKNFSKFKFLIKNRNILFRSLFLRKRIPFYVGLFITERCNLKCVYCFPDSPNRTEKDPPKEKIFNLVDELYDRGTRYITILGGEPMIRNDFNEIIDYITDKGILVEIGTNGFLTSKWIDTLKKVYLVCHSIDGDEAGHDANRGKGSYKKIMESIELCRKNGIKIQLRTVFNKNNIQCLDYLVKLANEFDSSLALAEQAYVREGNNQYLLSPEKLSELWKKVYEYKKKGYKIDKSYVLLDNIIKYPKDISVGHIFYKDEKLPETLQKLPECFLSNGYCFIDIDGYMYPCAEMFGKYGKNVYTDGVDKAWDYLDQKPCVMCRQSIQDLKSYFFSSNIKSMFVVLRNFLQK